MRYWKGLIVFLPAILLLGSCAAPSYKTYSHFDPKEAKKLLQEGPNTIKGSALIRQRGGGVVTCAGRPVHLVPATDYAGERIFVIYGRRDRGFSRKPGSFENEPLDFKELVRETRCDAQGYFSFNHVADGTFFVTVQITWSAGNYSAEGGNLMERVTVSNGETKEIVLAP